MKLHSRPNPDLTMAITECRCLGGAKLSQFKDEPKDLDSRIVSAIGKAGPRNIAELARITGAHRETIRYKVKTRFERRGLRIRAQPDYEKIGLDPFWGYFYVAKSYRDRFPHLLRVLNEVGYMVTCAKTLPNGQCAAYFVLPRGKREQYEALLSWLKSRKVLLDFTFNQSLIHYHPDMNPRFFNFKSCRWQVNWDELKASPPPPLPASRRTDTHKEDYYDLLILGELQKDALKHVSAMARSLKVNHKTLEYHYRHHVVKRGMVSSYWVRWEGSRPRAHSEALFFVRFRPIRRAEFKKVHSVVGKIPFLWTEDFLSDGTFVALMRAPLTEMISGLEYIGDELPDLGPRADINLVKFDEVPLLTVPYHLWKGGGWAFDIDEMKAAVKECLQSKKGEADSLARATTSENEAAPYRFVQPE